MKNIIRDKTLAFAERNWSIFSEYIFGAAIGMTVVLVILLALFRAMMRT